MPRTWRTTVLALLLMLSAAPAGAQQLRIRPALLLADGDVFPGLRFTLEGTRGGLVIQTNNPREWSFGADVDVPLTWDADRNPEPLRAALRGGLQLSFFQASTPTGGVPSPDDPAAVSNGYLSLDLKLAGEAPQSFDFGDAAFGVAVSYEHDQYHRLWFVPEVSLAFDGVVCIECETDAEEVDNPHTRLAGEIGWSVPLDRGWVPGPVRPVWIRLQGRGFKTWGMDERLESIRHPDGLWGMAELAYRLDNTGWLHELFVNWRVGDHPQRLLQDRAWGIGASVYF